ncbi:hypothetical protein C2G38_2154748 [Gigaspora rosea]|uniref:Uncharacterized protein n=1 Tax=Gigaspora rosea TaxID=44941 RepID=A0A397W8K9_9GLOM|nr:hypothetical protein C2G38_2154748 [Gigaspora rosea]
MNPSMLILDLCIDFGLKDLELKCADLGLEYADLGLECIDLVLECIDLELECVDLGLEFVDLKFELVDPGLKCMLSQTTNPVGQEGSVCQALGA